MGAKQKAEKLERVRRKNIYDVFAECIEQGITAGWEHAHKHTNTPAPNEVRAEIYSAIMLAVSEQFEFSNDGGL